MPTKPSGYNLFKLTTNQIIHHLFDHPQKDRKAASLVQEALVASDATVATQLGTTNEIVSIKMVGEERTVSFDEYDMPVVALLAGDVDTVIIDEVAAVGFMGANPGEMKVAFAVTGGEFLANVFPPLSDLTTPVTWAMQQMFADGTMDEICETWLLRPCTPE